MFDSFVNKFREVVDKFIGKPLPKNLDEVLKELKLTLLEADVDSKLAEDIISKISIKIKNDKSNLPLSDKFLNSLYEVLSEVIGEGGSLSIDTIPYKILLVGLFGSGKTTTAGKLALYYKKRGLKVLLVGLDIHRAAADIQIKQIAEQVGVKYIIGKDLDEIISQEKKIEKQFDVIIIDTAGRSSVDEDLIKEIRKIKEEIKPNNVLLVISADIGQNASSQVKAFHNALGISSIIITKTDTSAKGGGALVAAYISHAKIVFVGDGEKLNSLTEFNKDSFIKRLIGVDRIGGILEKIKQEDVVVKEETVNRFLKNEFNLIDFYEQFKAASKVGVSNIISNLGLNSKEDLDSKIKDFLIIMNSMTWEELNNPEIINSSRIRRISKGSGKTEDSVRELLSTYKKTKQALKLMNNRNIGKLLSKFGFKL
ncbi:MAG: signal recognition particle receptor subunit alpha [Candidatus Rehaiarchaeum fermentans]|nr:signal recognition particle receptor subunit alpha [Candidatus Rehaiarchaeum fermentans]